MFHPTFWRIFSKVHNIPFIVYTAPMTLWYESAERSPFATKRDRYSHHQPKDYKGLSFAKNSNFGGKSHQYVTQNAAAICSKSVHFDPILAQSQLNCCFYMLFSPWAPSIVYCLAEARARAQTRARPLDSWVCLNWAPSAAIPMPVRWIAIKCTFGRVLHNIRDIFGWMEISIV